MQGAKGLDSWEALSSEALLKLKVIAEMIG